MSPVAPTRTTTALLSALEDPTNDGAWRELLGRCEPIMRGVAVRMGVPDSEVDDMVQSAMVTFLEAWRRGQYDRGRGRLSNFLVTILRSRVVDHRRRWARRAGLGPTARDRSCAITPSDGADPRGVDDGVGAPAEVERLWDDERQQQILLAALAELRTQGVDARAVAAFELYAIRRADAGAVAAELGMTRDEVYETKYQLTRRLQPIVARLDELYEDI